MSDSVRPHRRQSTRLPRPWDSPGKNTGVGCHFLLQCVKVKSESEVAQSCPNLATPWTAAHQAPPSMGFSRQKYWSGVPLPSPMIISHLQTNKQTFFCIVWFVILRNYFSIILTINLRDDLLFNIIKKAISITVLKYQDTVQAFIKIK